MSPPAAALKPRFTALAPTAPHGGDTGSGVPMARPRFAADLPAVFAAPDAPVQVRPVGASGPDDASLLPAAPGYIAMAGLDRLIEIDEPGLCLRAQAGVRLDTAAAALASHGLFLPVPAARPDMTLGAAVATDAIGPNHALVGSFGAHVRRIELVRSDKGPISLSPEDPLFRATIGGHGLTGAIVAVEIGALDVDSAFLDVETGPATSLGGALGTLRAENDWDFAWAELSCTPPHGGVLTRCRFRDDGRLARQPGDRLAEAVRRLRPNSQGAAVRHYAPTLWPSAATRADAWGAHLVLPDAEDAALGAALASAHVAGARTAKLYRLGAHAPAGLARLPGEGWSLAARAVGAGGRAQGLAQAWWALALAHQGRLLSAAPDSAGATERRFHDPHWSALEALRDPAVMSSAWARTIAP